MSTPSPQYCTVEHLSGQAYGLDLPAELEPELSALIVKAERRLLRHAPTACYRLDRGTLSPAEVADVVADMVLRVVRNPAGVAQEQAGEYSYRIDWRVAAGRLTVLPEDLRNLGLSPNARPRTIRVGTPVWRIR